MRNAFEDPAHAGTMRAGVVALVMLAVALAGCGKGTESLSNTADNFRYTGEWSGKGDTLRYAWSNSKAGANLTVSGDATAGSVQVRVADAAGAPMGEGGLAPGSPTARARLGPGQPGDWRVEIAFTGFSGQVTVQVRAG